MSTAPKRYLITAALPYANGPIHIGHLAGCYLPADIYVRYLKATGKEVLFICGSDEHGVPITIKAKKENKTPQQVVDHYHALMRDAFHDFGIEFSYYGRTSSKVHHDTAQDFFKNLYDKGVFNEETTRQYYDEEAKQFLADRYITGTCPRCGNPGAYGDQCEKCGTSLNPTDLINPKSALSGASPVLKETKNWFLPLGELQQSEAFQNYIQRFENWKSNIKGQCASWLNEGLQPRAMTRDLDWGVPVPVKDAAGKVLYVWFDAPIGYISATKEFLAKSKTDTWETWWKNDDTSLIHFIGKDNIVFHAIIFPMMLLSHGEYILPDNVPANEFMNLEGDKISTSRNWAVWLHEYLQDFPGKQDVLRYALCAAAPETKDNDFTWKDFQARNNNELVAILGNFVNRTLVLTHKFYEGKVPAFDYKEEGFDEASVAMHVLQSKDKIEKSLDQFRFREALFEVMEVARVGNKFLADHEPWKLVKTNEKKTAAIMNIALQLCANLSALMKPFLPASSLKLETMLGQTVSWHDIGSMLLLPEGHVINEAELLYEKIEDDVIERQVQKLHASRVTPPAAQEGTVNLQQVKADISYEDFDKLDLRAGVILEAEKVPKADKLLKLTVDLGFEKRTILSGIAEYYTAEEMIGKRVTVVANLAPRKIRGIESQGMLLMAGNDFGKLFVVSAESDIDPGSVVK
ncbi:MAG: methionine--tRNA ligase [Bacteroidia bacterium]|jgi:methionyl-tRNA synthetase